MKNKHLFVFKDLSFKTSSSARHVVHLIFIFELLQSASVNNTVKKLCELQFRSHSGKFRKHFHFLFRDFECVDDNMVRKNIPLYREPRNTGIRRFVDTNITESGGVNKHFLVTSKRTFRSLYDGEKCPLMQEGRAWKEGEN